MNLEEVKLRVITIQKAQVKAQTETQIEALHIKRDELWAEVLQDTVNGNWLADHLAAEALKLAGE
jgi:hypothetical protein